MITPRDPAHYLKLLSSTTTPRRLLWLDCAAVGSKEAGAFMQRWHCGALGRTWYTSKRGQRRDAIDTFDTTRELWEAVDKFCPLNRRTVLWSYDLAYQLRIAAGLVELPQLGWHLEKIVLERTAAWASFKDGKRTLLMCDLKSWAPVEFGKLAADVHGFRGDWHDIPAGVNYHHDRCAMRVGVVRHAVLQILDWIQAENLGPFRPTGSGQSYSAYRRRFMAHDLLVHDDTTRLHAERVAMWTGRCEAWQHGALVNGPFVEYDMQAAYCRIAAECDIPIRAESEIRHRDINKLIDIGRTQAVLAHVTVDTDIPCIPTKLGGRTLWPVGTFSTWLWDPELFLAAYYCNSVTVHKAYRYATAPALKDFARFVLDGLSDQTTIYGNVPARVMKHWSRCLVGRLGLRYRAWTRFGTSPMADVRLVTYIDTDEGTSTDMLVAGYDRFILSDMSESVDSMPQIPSWVMSECRRRLWDAMMVCGLSNVVYADTDSVIINANNSQVGEYGPGIYADTRWTRKGTYKRLTVHGPRNYFTENDRVVSGLPKTARQLAPLEFSGEVMRSIKESMRSGELSTVATIPRKFVLDAPDMRREHLPNHRTAPFRVQLQQEDF